MMWLKMQTEVAEIHFRLRGYCELNKKYTDDEWCLVDLAIRSEDLNYSLYNDEALEIGEVRMIESALETALRGDTTEPIHIAPMLGSTRLYLDDERLIAALKMLTERERFIFEKFYLEDESDMVIGEWLHSRRRQNTRISG